MTLSHDAERILKFLSDSISNGYSPSVREIGLALSIPSTSTVQKRLNELSDAGFITRTQGTNRSIRLNVDCSFTPVALVGSVAAGSPILAVENITDYIPVSRSLGSQDELFALKIKGDSMINAGIFDGDTVIVKRAQTVQNGEIAVAMIDGEATVKRFFRENGHFRLQPENDDYSPIITSSLSILGKVVALFRFI